MTIESRSSLSSVETRAEPLLAVRDLTLRYHRRTLSGQQGRLVTALEGVSLDLFAGKILALIGPSGSGKSSLARAIVMLERPDAGQILYRGTNLLQLGSAERRKIQREIQIVFQDSAAALNPTLTVEEILGEPFAIHKHLATPDSRLGTIHRLLDRFEVPHGALRRRPLELSGGQRQRVAIARAIALKPRILILDESLSALDLSTQGQIANLLLDLREREGLSYLYITHDLSMAALLADEVLEIAGGRVSPKGTQPRGLTANQHSDAGALSPA